MQSTRFNVFQRIMRLWDEVHPYNAAQVLHLNGFADLDRAQAAWTDTLATLGIGSIHVESDRFRHDACKDSRIHLVDPNTPLEAHISAEMNRPFLPDESGACCPFRPFLQQGDGTYHFGVIYHHWVADSASIRRVLREWFLRLYDPSRISPEPLRIPRGGYWHFFGPSHGHWGLGEGVLSTLRFATRFGHVRRLDPEAADYSVRCSVHPFPDGLIDDLRNYTRREGLKLNDLFLAAAAEACDRHGVPPRTGPRPELALGTIVDLRPSCAHDMENVFGLFLGFTTVTVRPQALDHWPTLVRTIAQQTALHKRSHLAQASLVRMAAAVAEARWLSPADWVKFYVTHMPLAAGISNVNLAQTWAAEYYPRILLDYVRFSPTGPTLPVVFTPTSLGAASHLALTTRTALIDEARTHALAAAFIQRLRSLVAPDSSQRTTPEEFPMRRIA